MRTPSTAVLRGLGWSEATTLAVALALSSVAGAQLQSSLAGDYAGDIAGEQATLHLTVGTGGALNATLDHLDPRAPWMFICADVRLDGQSLSFSVPTVGAMWKGTLSTDGKTLSGTWTQKGGSLFASFVLQPFVPSTSPSPVDGIWLGVLPVTANTSTRVQIVVRSDASGREYCTMDFIDVYTMGLQCANAVFKDQHFSFDLPAAGEHWTETLSADGKSLSGTLSLKQLTATGERTVTLPAGFDRQNTLSLEKARPAVTYDNALPPVTAADLKSVLDRDLTDAIKNGELAPATGAGVSIAVYSHGDRRVFSYGSAKPDSIFEIGSTTKTFTGLLLSQMAMQGKVRLDEPVRELLPPSTVAKPAGAEITLIDLATQRSGLPPMPDNIDLIDMDQPYAKYHAADLLAYIGKHGVANSTSAASQFGSLGFGLLGVALANRAGTSYAALLKQEITDPLGLKDTVIELSPEQDSRFVAGHDEFHGPAKAWSSDALAGAIAIRSTAPDMLAYLEANLHPEKIKAESGSKATLPAALRQSLQPQGEVVQTMRIALGWLYHPETGNYWHNGATAAYSSYAFFNPKGDYAAVVLLNESPGANGSFVENLGRHISQRLAGKRPFRLHRLCEQRGEATEKELAPRIWNEARLALCNPTSDRAIWRLNWQVFLKLLVWDWPLKSECIRLESVPAIRRRLQSRAESLAVAVEGQPA